jgi:hypothetical protein
VNVVAWAWRVGRGFGHGEVGCVEIVVAVRGVSGPLGRAEMCEWVICMGDC